MMGVLIAHRKWLLLIPNSQVVANSISVLTMQSQWLSWRASDRNSVGPGSSLCLISCLFFFKVPLIILRTYTTYKHQTCTSMLLVACEFYIISTIICLVITITKESLITMFFLVEHIIVDIQLHPTVLKVALLTILSYRVKGSWGIVLMRESLQKHLQGRYNNYVGVWNKTRLSVYFDRSLSSF